MMGYLNTPERGLWWPRLEPVLGPRGLPLLRLTLPERGDKERNLERGVRKLRRAGAERVLFSTAWAPECGKRSEGVDPLPLCRAMVLELAQWALADIPCRERRVILRGEGSEGTLQRCARWLCPRCGRLCLEMRGGGERLAAQLRQEFGAAVLLGPGGRGESNQLCIAFRPGESHAQREICLYGHPNLGGGELYCPGIEGDLELLEVLWESRRVLREEIMVREGGKGQQQVFPPKDEKS